MWQVLSTAYQRLGFDAVADAAFMQLVLARVVEPTSRSDFLRVLDELGVEHASLRTRFRTLQQPGPVATGDQVAAACFTHATSHGDLSLVLYDVTTSSIEAEREDDLRRAGYSKERRIDPQIVVGLAVDRAGFPLESAAWKATPLRTTTLPIVTQFQDRHGLADMVVVADAGCSRRPTSSSCTPPACGSSSAPASRRPSTTSPPLPLARRRVH